MRSGQIQKRLLAEKSLTWKTAVEMALAMEVAVKQTNNFRNSPADSGIHYVRSPHPLKVTKPKRPCFRCGEDHDSPKCRFKKELCRNCKSKRHIAKVCKKKAPASSGGYAYGLRSNQLRWEKTTSSVRGERHPSKRAKRRLQTISHSSGKA